MGMRRGGGGGIVGGEVVEEGERQGDEVMPCFFLFFEGYICIIFFSFIF